MIYPSSPNIHAYNSILEIWVHTRKRDDLCALGVFCVLWILLSIIRSRKKIWFGLDPDIQVVDSVDSDVNRYCSFLKTFTFCNRLII